MSDNATDDVDWDEGEDVVVRTQRAIRVYLNRFDEIVIAQESGDMSDEYPIVTIRPENVRAVIAALIRVAELRPVEAK